MDDFARRADDDRLAFINEAAARRDVTPIIIEKDFWVCWTLRRLMSVPVLAENITFKGGTSLSKAYGIIERFSEDIDLTIGRKAPMIIDTLPPMEKNISGKERERRTKALKAAAQTFVQEIALPELSAAIAQALGKTDGWSVLIDPEDHDAQTILFRYPVIGNFVGDFDPEQFDHREFETGAYGYILPRVKLEFGARGETEPSELRTISPYLAQEFPDELPDATISVSTLSVERTFWEKVTILHALHQPDESAHDERLLGLSSASGLSLRARRRSRQASRAK